MASLRAQCGIFFFFNDTATTEIYTLSLHDALPILAGGERRDRRTDTRAVQARHGAQARNRHVLPVEGQDLTAPRETAEERAVGEGALQQGGDPARGRLARGVQTQEVEPERIARQSEHA